MLLQIITLCLFVVPFLRDEVEVNTKLFTGHIIATPPYPTTDRTINIAHYGEWGWFNVS